MLEQSALLRDPRPPPFLVFPIRSIERLTRRPNLEYRHLPEKTRLFTVQRCSTNSLINKHFTTGVEKPKDKERCLIFREWLSGGVKKVI